MLEKLNATPMIAVKNIKAAKKFYAEKLGIQVEPVGEASMAQGHFGTTDFLLYESEFAGTNKANTLAWSVGSEFDSVIKELKSKGIQFEHYDNLPGTRVQGDIHIAGDMKLAWFKDPDGNILHVMNA